MSEYAENRRAAAVESLRALLGTLAVIPDTPDVVAERAQVRWLIQQLDTSPPLAAPEQRTKAGAWLLKELEFWHERRRDDDEIAYGPYDEIDTTASDNAVLWRWVWEQVDPEGYAAWLDGVAPRGIG